MQPARLQKSAPPASLNEKTVQQPLAGAHLFGLAVSLFFQNFNNFLLYVALYYYFAILCTATDTAFCFQQSGKLAKVAAGANEIPYYGGCFPAAMMLLDAHSQLLLLLGQCIIFFLFIGKIFEIGVSGIDYVKPLLPVVFFHVVNSYGVCAKVINFF